MEKTGQLTGIRVGGSPAKAGRVLYDMAQVKLVRKTYGLDPDPE